MATEIFTWWLVLQIFGLLGLPFAAFLFRTLPDRGYAFSKTLGLLLTGYGAWLLAMFGLGSFGVPLVLLVMVGLAGGGGLLLRSIWGLPLQWATLKVALQDQIRAHWRGILAYEALFLAALVGVAWMRGHDLGFVGPNPWGTERPMDFAFLNAIRYSATFPPADPWLSGFSINYYYFGYLLMAVVAMLSGLAPGVAYNLSLAGIFALTALGVAGIVSNLIALAQEPGQELRTKNQEPGIKNQELHTAKGSRFSVLGSWFSLLAVVLVLLVGNQAGALQVLVGDYRIVALDGQQLVTAVTQALADPTQPIVLPHPAQTSEGEFSTITTLERGDRVQDFNWWWPSRALWDETNGVRFYNITEFPFFSFWLGDMHPHVMALPFNLLALALALATLARVALPQFAVGREGWLELLLTGLVLGSLYTINSWDLPTYILLYGAALTVLYVRTAGSFNVVSWRDLGKQAGLVVVALVVLFIPFYLTFKSLVGFAEPLVNIPLLSRLTQIIAPVVASRSGLHAFLMIFGLFLLPLVAFTYLNATGRPARLAEGQTGQEHEGEPIAAGEAGQAASIPGMQLQAELDEPRGRPAAIPPRIVVGQSGGQGALLMAEGQVTTTVRRPAAWQWLFSPWLPLVLLLVGVLTGFPLLALAGLGLFATYQAVVRSATPAERFVLLVVALGCAICFGTELIYIRDVFSSRMNTIFKFYYQVWLLWGTTAAFALWWLLAYSQAAVEATATSAAVRMARRAVAYGTLALVALLLLGGLVYPAINLRNVARDGTWVGLAGRTPREQYPAGQAATQWIRENVPPGSIVLEMVAPGGGSYNGEGYAGVSASTGRPTVLGWVGHQVQWRGGDAAARAQLDPRQMDVDTIYGTTDPNQALTLLRKYNVRYVYVGELERRGYPPESLDKFAEIARPVFQMEQVTIYQLPEPSL